MEIVNNYRSNNNSSSAQYLTANDGQITIPENEQTGSF